MSNREKHFLDWLSEHQNIEIYEGQVYLNLAHIIIPVVQLHQSL